jgi:chaperonin GroEL
MSRLITHVSNQKQKILDGIKATANVVGSTFGPIGSNVIIKHENVNMPQSTKDGVTVAKILRFDDEYENIGCQLVKQASLRTAQQAGDGTTSSVLLASALCERIHEENIKDCYTVKKHFDTMTQACVQYVKSKSIHIKNLDDIRNIAHISSNGDSQISNIICKAYSQFKDFNGVIMVEPSETTETYVKIQSGTVLKSDIVSTHFFKNVQQVIEFQNCAVFATNKKIDQTRDILDILQRIKDLGYSDVLLVCENIVGEALQAALVNNANSKMNIAIITPPFYGENRKEFMELFMTMIGGKYHDSNSGIKLRDIDMAEYFGVVGKVKVEKSNTTLYDYEKTDVSEYVQKYKEAISKTDDESKKSWLEYLISFTSGSIASIHVGGDSDTEVYERRDRIDDALCAVRSAVQEGYVAGGCAIYFSIAKNLKCPDNVPIHIFKIYIESLMSLFDQLVKNAIPQEYADDANMGYDIENDKICDMLQIDVIDPTKVVENVILNATSVACLFLTSDTYIVCQETDLL